jgi:hypothetical protein
VASAAKAGSGVVVVCSGVGSGVVVVGSGVVVGCSAGAVGWATGSGRSGGRHELMAASVSGVDQP